MHWTTRGIAGTVAVVGLLTLAGCGGAAPMGAGPTAASGAGSPVIPATATAPTAVSPTRSPASTTPAAGKPASPAAAATLTLVLKVLEPIDESVVNQANQVVRGQTTAGAVVSVNAALATVDAAGVFSAAITLDEGANLIEVVASDSAGNVLTQQILVVFEP